jgi:glycosyltransferase involved in cell wall biosynthesis
MLALPRVSVIVSCYNYAKCVEMALDSVAAQSYPNFECVVIDDASQDNSLAVVEDWVASVADTRFRLVVCLPNRGQLSAIAEGLAATDGEFVVMLDADDLWLPEFFHRHVQTHLNTLASSSASCSELVLIDQDGRILSGNTFRRDLGNAGKLNRLPVPATALSRLGPHGAIWPLRSTCRITACARKSTARSRRVSRCLGARPEPTAASPRCAPRSSTSRQKGPMGLYIRTIGIARARAKIGLANLLYNMKRLVWLTVQTAPA